jgi:hypothetical protein
MPRHLIATLIAAGSLAAIASPSFAQDAYTTRIEPRAFYGATVTIEAGVRVFRPIPATRHFIVNPDGATPLNLGYYDTRVREESTSYNYNYYEGVDPSHHHYGYRGGGFPTDLGRSRRHHRNHGYKD